MTAQAHERLLINGESFGMASTPLSSYLENLPVAPLINAPTSGCWRGYIGTWELRDQKLYLIALKVWGEAYDEKTLDYLFPGQEEVFADWFTGEIRLQTGEMLRYVHGGYGSVYEKDLFLSFEKGVCTGQWSVTNTAGEEPINKFLEGYGSL